MMSSFIFNAVSTILLTVTLTQFSGFRALPHNHGDQDNLHQAQQISNDKSGESICNKYTFLIPDSSTPTNQRLLMTLFVNTTLVDNYTTPNTGISVNGIMWPGEWHDIPINLMPDSMAPSQALIHVPMIVAKVLP